MQQQVFVMNQNTKRETGKKAQVANIAASQAVASIVRTTLGPRSMLKMLIDPMGGIVITNDGNCILRELDVSHPAAKSMIELSRSQDEEVGDGTTSVIVLSGEMLAAAQPFLEAGQMHPTQVVAAFYLALTSALKVCDEIAKPFYVQNEDDDDVDESARLERESLRKVIRSSVGTKFTGRWGDSIIDLAAESVSLIATPNPMDPTKKDIDIKRYLKVEKIAGGEIEDCRVVRGIVLNKDVTHSKMRRRIENPKIILLDCPLEYKKGESQTHVEITDETDWDTLLKLEEEYVYKLCADIISHKPDLVFTEKGVSDLAQHYLYKAGITAMRRLRKTDNNRLARACGATIVSRTDEIQQSDVGTGAGLFEIRKIGDDYYCFVEECADPKACTVLVRGGSRDVLNEVERNLQDALQVARNVAVDPRLVPGGGALEMAISQRLLQESKTIEGVQQWPFKALSSAFEVIPRTLAENCGADVVRLITELRAIHAKSIAENDRVCSVGLDGQRGLIVDMEDDSNEDACVWDPYVVKVQSIKTAIESAAMLLRIDDVLTGN